MHITLEMYGPLRQYNKGQELRAELDIREDMTVRELLVDLGMDMGEPWNAGLNGTLASPSDKLSDGDLLIVFPPMAGG